MPLTEIIRGKILIKFTFKGRSYLKPRKSDKSEDCKILFEKVKTEVNHGAVGLEGASSPRKTPTFQPKT